MFVKFHQKKSGDVVLVITRPKLDGILSGVQILSRAAFSIAVRVAVGLKNWKAKRWLFLGLVGMLIGIHSTLLVFSRPQPGLASPVVQSESYLDSPLVPIRLLIPKLGLEIEVQVKHRSETKDFSQRVVYWDPTSSLLGGSGTVSIFGPKKAGSDQLFSDLDRLQLGDEVLLTAQNGGVKLYRVIETRKIKPHELESIKAVPRDQLVLVESASVLSEVLAAGTFGSSEFDVVVSVPSVE